MADKIVMVTGAGSGIGREVSLTLLENGYGLVLAGRRRDKLEEVAAEGDPARQRTLCVSTDIADRDSVSALFAATRERFGRLDILFNNAGTGAPAVPLEDLTFEQFMTVVNTNLVGTFLCTQEAFRIMKSQEPRGGRIINNGSMAASVPRPFSAPYTSTKHAITGLTRSTSLDGRAYDIACGQIDIGNAASVRTEKMAEGILQPDGSIKVEPLLDLRHVADAVLYMANLPLEANVQFLTVMATKMPFIGRG